MIDIDALEKLRKEATGGVYHYDPKSGGIGSIYNENGYLVVADTDQEDAEYLIALHNAFPAILAKLRAGRELRDTCKQALIEVQHAQSVGASWYTNDSSGLYRQVSMWVRRGLDSIIKFDAMKG